MKLLSIDEAARIIRAGGVVAYPVEACYGLGCNPLDRRAVQRIMRLKGRSMTKGVILIADHSARFARFIRALPEARMAAIRASWPGPYTWLMPARAGVSALLRGQHDTLALRVTAHKVGRTLCKQSAMALVSTSANRSQRPPIRQAWRVMAEFGDDIDGVVEGRIGTARSPSTIIDAVTGTVIRN